MQYFLPNDHLSRFGCNRRLATEQHLKLNNDKSFFKYIVLFCSHIATTNTQELHLIYIVMISSIQYYTAIHLVPS